MALSWTITQRVKMGKYTQLTGTVAFDSSYPTGGEDFSAGMGNKVIHLALTPKGGYSFSTDYTNKKLLAYVPISVAGGAAAASTDALSIKASVVDKEAATAMHSTAKEVPDTTSLAALTGVPFICQQL